MEKRSSEQLRNRGCLVPDPLTLINDRGVEASQTWWIPFNVRGSQSEDGVILGKATFL